MSTIDLIILGSLYQSPKSAYELQKQIEDMHFFYSIQKSYPI